MGLQRLIKAALTSTRPMARFGFCGPLRVQAKTIAWGLLKRLVRDIPDTIINEGELRVDFTANDSQIRIFGVDSADSLRGGYFDGLCADEYGLWDDDIYPLVIRPMLADRQGWVQLQGTPNGKNQFYTAKEHAITSNEWAYLELRWKDTGAVPKAEIDQIRNDVSEEQFLQEWECDFSSSVRGAIFGQVLRDAESDTPPRITRVPHTPALPTDTHWDLGMRDPMAILFTQKTHMEVRIIDCYQATGQSFDFYARVLQEKARTEGYYYRDHYAPHDIKVRELGSGKSRLEMAAGLGIHFIETKNIPIVDGINNARAMFKRIWIDREKCAELLEALHHYRYDYDDKALMYKATPHKDWTNHYADCTRYLCLNYEADTMRPPGPVKVHSSL